MAKQINIKMQTGYATQVKSRLDEHFSMTHMSLKSEFKMASVDDSQRLQSDIPHAVDFRGKKRHSTCNIQEEIHVTGPWNGTCMKLKIKLR